MEKTFESHELSSRCHGYDFNALAVKPFGMKSLRLMSKTMVSNEAKFMIEAVDNVIPVDVNTLTIGDFYQLLAYQRYTAFPSSPPEAEWTCEGERYKLPTGEIQDLVGLRALVDIWDAASAEQRQAGGLIDPNTLEVTKVKCGHVNKIELKYLDFPLIQLPEEQPELDDRLDYPRVSVLPSLLEALADPQFTLVAPAAQWVKDGNDIFEKIAILEQEPDLELYDLAAKYNQLYTHGISETAVFECALCKTKTNHVLKIEPSIFFRL